MPPGKANVTVAGLRTDSSGNMSFIGCSKGVTIVDPTPVVHDRTKPAISEGNFSIEVVNLQGRVVRRLAGDNSHTYPISALLRGTGAGVYLVRMQNATTGKSLLRKRVVTGTRQQLFHR